MKTLSLIFTLMAISAYSAFSQDIYDGFELKGEKNIPHLGDSMTIENMLKTTPFQSNMKIHKTDPDEMAPMPYAQIDTTTNYPMLIKEYELAMPEKTPHLKKEKLKDNN